MAPLGRRRRRLHAGRPAADHHHPLRRARARHLAIDELAAGLGMLDAGDREPELEMADAGLVAADAARMSSVRPASPLAGHLRVADQRPVHAAQIGRTLGEDAALGLVRLIDPAGHQHRCAGRLLDLGREGRQIAAGVNIEGTMWMAPPAAAEVPAMTFR
ncbi:MAG: hypothetical protein R3D33_04285 [Hyphomicrobiaceae bacterium]